MKELSMSDNHLFRIPRIHVNIANNITMIAGLLQTKVGNSEKYIIQNIISTFVTIHKMTSSLSKNTEGNVRHASAY